MFCPCPLEQKERSHIFLKSFYWTLPSRVFVVISEPWHDMAKQKRPTQYPPWFTWKQIIFTDTVKKTKNNNKKQENIFLSIYLFNMILSKCTIGALSYRKKDPFQYNKKQKVHSNILSINTYRKKRKQKFFTDLKSGVVLQTCPPTCKPTNTLRGIYG